MITPDPQSPSPSASLVETEETPEKREIEPDATEPAVGEDAQLKYTSA
jgi:hypothetical protein